MDCVCNINVDLDDNWELLNKKYPIAKIQHICFECKTTEEVKKLALKIIEEEN